MPARTLALPVLSFFRYLAKFLRLTLRKRLDLICSNFCKWQLIIHHKRLYFDLQPYVSSMFGLADDERAETKSSSAHPENTSGALPARRDYAPAVLLHGFGASLFSWQRVLKPLAAVIGSSVVAFDRPAFGLTSRPRLNFGETQETRRANPYSLEFSARATVSFVEFLHAQQIILIG